MMLVMTRNTDDLPSRSSESGPDGPPRTRNRTDMSTTTELRATPGPASPDPDASRPGPLGRIAGVAYRHRGRMVLAWLGVLVVAFALSATLGGTFKADYSAPGSDSKAAQTLLQTKFPAQSGDTVNVVVHSTAPVTSPSVKAAVTA